jgi:hypothetical protein
MMIFTVCMVFALLLLGGSTAAAYVSAWLLYRAFRKIFR